jgi:hypothetical protein
MWIINRAPAPTRRTSAHAVGQAAAPLITLAVEIPRPAIISRSHSTLIPPGYLTAALLLSYHRYIAQPLCTSPLSHAAPGTLDSWFPPRNNVVSAVSPPGAADTLVR